MCSTLAARDRWTRRRGAHRVLDFVLYITISLAIFAALIWHATHGEWHARVSLMVSSRQLTA